MTSRWIRIWLFVYLALLPAVTRAQSASAANESISVALNQRRSFREIVMMPVVYRAPGMDNVRVQTNLKYTNVSNPNLLMDVYTPPDVAKDERRPAVLFIHGGAGAETRPKDWGIYTSWGRLIAASGLVGVTFTHRLGYPKPLLVEAASDVKAAIDYVRANAASLNVDKDRICLAAYSAGGPMLSLAMREKPAYVRCIVAFYAFLDIQHSEMHRTHESAEIVKAFSPITHLEEGAGKIAPMFIARAGLDEIPTMNDSIDRFIREAISKNAMITVANHAQGVHGFDNQNDDQRSRELIRGAIDFMKTHLGFTTPLESSIARSQVKQETQVREFVAAVNVRDIEKIFEAVDEAVQWLSVSGAKITVEVEGKSALREWMGQYFRNCPSCASSLEEVHTVGSRVIVTERATWSGKNGLKSQKSLSVYEFHNGKILRVYYFPAEVDAQR